MKETIIKYKNTYQELPEIPHIKKLWHQGYWDGPCNGVCEVDNKKCWFELIDEWVDHNEWPDEDLDFEPLWYRRFLIVQLTDEQFQELKKRHEKFQRMVGTHCDYNDKGERGYYQPNDTTDQYYKEQKSEPDYVLEAASDSHVIGWYQQ